MNDRLAFRLLVAIVISALVLIINHDGQAETENAPSATTAIRR